MKKYMGSKLGVLLVLEFKLSPNSVVIWVSPLFFPLSAFIATSCIIDIIIF
jgi:hypothetical protein